MRIPLARWLQSLILVAGAVIVSLSPLSAPYALLGWGVVAFGSALALIIFGRVKDRFLRFVQRIFPQEQAGPLPWAGLGPLDLALLATVASATIQILVAINLPSPSYLPLHNTPGVAALYLLLAGALAFLHCTLAAGLGDRGRAWTALVTAGVFSSTLYLRAFATAEAGPVFGPVLALALIAASTLWGSGRVGSPAARRHQLDRVFTLTSFALLATVALAVLFSPVPRQSLDFWLRWAALITLAMMLSLSLDGSRAWRAMAWATVMVAGGLPVLLAGVKFLSLIPAFGLTAALSYRLHPNEFGGANLVARSMVCVIPLAIALMSHRPQRARRRMMFAIVAAGASVVLYARSWDGLFALLISLGVYGIAAYWHVIARGRRRVAASPRLGWLAMAGIVVVAVPVILFSIRVARQTNVYSFNARLIHWYGALLAWQDHLWVGGGPGNENVYVPYADQASLLVDTQVTVDAPLTVVGIQAGRPLEHHAHNLLLGLGATTGLVGVLAFGVLVLSILVVGLRAWGRRNGIARSWMAGCLAGIAGALAWGMLDMLWVAPPFFSFPVWALIGLLLAAGRFQADGNPEPVPDSAGQASGPRRPSSVLVSWTLVVLALLVVLLPALASVHYAAGFAAFQERRWSQSVPRLEAAVRYGWRDPQMYGLLAEAYLAQGDMERAQQTYRQAANLKQGFSPYLSRLGWLAWWNGDLEKAVESFEWAVELDPAEIGHEGLHADLGIVYAAQGNDRQALVLLADAIELDPAAVLSSLWAPGAGGSYTITTALDPAYLQAPSPELNRHILAHLGAPDVTERVFAPTEAFSSSILLNDVLDAVEADYRQAAAEGKREAPLLLAALAEASRLAGLGSRAEQAYLEFQAQQPNSAYGWRDLGLLYHNQGRLEEAQAMLERAVEVSPRDVDSHYRLALVYMDRELWDKAEQALAAITSQSLTTLFRSRLFDPDLYVATSRIRLAQGDLEEAIKARTRAAAIRELPEDHLALAALYRQAGQEEKATRACFAAAHALFSTWPRPLNPLLWDIGTCLAQSPGDAAPAEVTALAHEYPLAGNVLLGHLYRARGEHELALAAYLAAADARRDEGDPHYLLGETYQALGQPDLAEAEYRRATDLNPLESLPLLAMGRLQWAQGRQDEAIVTLRAAVEATPGWGEAQVELGNALLAVGDLPGAAQHFHQARLADRNVDQQHAYDFVAELASAEIESPGAEYVRGAYATIDGERQRALFMHPDSRARYTLQVPAQAELAFDVAMLDGSWEQPGDGVTFSVYVDSGSNLQQLFTTYIDPKQRAADRRWHSFVVNLDEYAGQTVTLILETGAGPGGDGNYDWAVWGDLLLVKP